VKRLLNLVGMTVGGWLGWQVGAFISVFTAYVIAVLGTGLGLYAAHRFTTRLLP